jgi:hypothetical protein
MGIDPLPLDVQFMLLLACAWDEDADETSVTHRVAADEAPRRNSPRQLQKALPATQRFPQGGLYSSPSWLWRCTRPNPWCGKPATGSRLRTVCYLQGTRRLAGWLATVPRRAGHLHGPRGRFNSQAFATCFPGLLSLPVQLTCCDDQGFFNREEDKKISIREFGLRSFTRQVPVNTMRLSSSMSPCNTQQPANAPPQEVI